ncbi:MAG: DNA primase [Rhodobacteraceae bacterium]|nr:DNA primase [Paracoccaceae bacterium]
MNLPPGFLDELRSRITLSQVVGRKVIWDLKKSNQARGDWWAPCPFHQERTASFHVDDRKGYYYCFGCHAKGDAVTFLREAENLAFMEAVERLAGEAGLAMPERDPKAAERADRLSRLADAMEAAVRHYRLMLRGSAGAEARAYLVRRRLGEGALDRFEIGFAPDDRQGLFKALTGKGLSPEILAEAGLVALPEGGGAPYDRFRGRIIFPIRDARGRCIALGGRALDPAAPAKYLNSPETPLFDKGRSLYNHGPAREAAGKGHPLIVAEGYVDVIALVEAGFAAAVAPLGTAITEDQLRLLWRIAPEPVIALDGDRAGIAAAMRLVDLALPLIEAGQSLRFVLMPEGLDPDDLIRAQGAEAMKALLEKAEPMVNLLWRRETEGRLIDSPERRAALDKRLRTAIARITDPSIRAHYADAIRQLRAGLFGAGPARPAVREQPAGRAGGRQDALPATPLPATRGSLLARAGEGVDEYLQEAIILAILVAHPGLAAEVEHDLDRLDMADMAHEQLRRILLDHAHDPDAARGALAQRAGPALERLAGLAHVRIAPPARPDADAAFALRCLTEEIARLRARRAARAETAEAMADIGGLADEGVTWRLAHAAEARHRAERSSLDDDADMGEDRAALSAGLQRLIDQEVWIKKKR